MAVLPKIPVPDLAIRFVAAARSNDVKGAAALVRSVAGTRDQSSFVRHVDKRVAEDRELESQVTRHRKALKTIPQNGVADFGAAFPLLWGALSGKVSAEAAYQKAMDVFLGRMSAEAETCLANLRQIDGVDGTDIELFLMNEAVHCVLGGHTVVLEAAHELCRLNVLGWYRGFQPTNHDAKFLSSGEDDLRNLALFNEYREAAYYARREEFNVRFSDPLDVNWELLLGISAEKHVREKVSERFPAAGDEVFAGLFDRYQLQTSVEVDLSIGAAKGNRLRRIVEVKTGAKNNCGAREWAKTLLQVFRHAAVVRTSRGKEEELEGVMYAFYSPSESLNDLLLKDIEEILILTAIPYSLCHVREGQRIPKGKGNLPESLGRKKTAPKAQTPPLGQSVVSKEEARSHETHVSPASIDRAERERRSWDYYAATPPEVAHPGPEVRAQTQRVPLKGFTGDTKNEISPVSKILALPVATEIFRKYPELEVVTQTQLQKYLEGLTAIPDAFVSSEGRSLFMLMAFLKEYREGLGVKATALAEEASLAIAAFTPSQDSTVRIVKDGFGSYEGLRERALPAIAASLVFDFPELQGSRPSHARDYEKGRALHHFLSTLDLTVEQVDRLRSLWKEAERTDIIDPESTYLRSLAPFYIRERRSFPLQRPIAQRAVRIPEEWKVFTGEIDKRIVAAHCGNDADLSDAFAFFVFLLSRCGPKDGLPKGSWEEKADAEMSALVGRFEFLAAHGGSLPHAASWMKAQLADFYQRHRSKIIDIFPKVLTLQEVQKIVARFSEVASVPLESTEGAEKDDAKAKYGTYFETVARVLKIFHQNDPDSLARWLADRYYPTRTASVEDVEKEWVRVGGEALLRYFLERLKMGEGIHRKKKAPLIPSGGEIPLPETLASSSGLIADLIATAGTRQFSPGVVLTRAEDRLLRASPEIDRLLKTTSLTAQGRRFNDSILDDINRFSFFYALSDDSSWRHWVVTLLGKEVLQSYRKQRDDLLDFSALISRFAELKEIPADEIERYKVAVAAKFFAGQSRQLPTLGDNSCRILFLLEREAPRFAKMLRKAHEKTPFSHRDRMIAKYYWDHRAEILQEIASGRAATNP